VRTPIMKIIEDFDPSRAADPHATEEIQTRGREAFLRVARLATSSNMAIRSFYTKMARNNGHHRQSEMDTDTDNAPAANTSQC
jgi:hypothetical protein